MKKLLILNLFFLTYIYSNTREKIDLNIIGNALFSDGLGRLPISLMYTLNKNIKINFIHSQKDITTNFQDIPPEVRKVIINSNDNIKSYVSILFDAPWHIYGKPFKKVPDSNIKFAYSMLESSQIPKKWVHIFNNHFDGVIVPDKSLTSVYQKSGVKIPIFVLPCILFLERLLNRPIKKKPNKLFKFGISAAFGIEKNHDILIKAFAKEFGNKLNVELLVHGRWGNTDHLKKIINEEKLKNVTLIEKVMPYEEYIRFLETLDCYVLISRGEGFSITPREALALAIPCILSNNSAQKTICETGLVKAVESKIKTPIFYKMFNEDCGYQLTCTVDDTQQALKEVYYNYGKYYRKALKAREWVKQYLPENLKSKYLNLIIPKKIIFDKKNIVTDNYIMTNSSALYQKYLTLIQQNKEIH